MVLKIIFLPKGKGWKIELSVRIVNDKMKLTPHFPIENVLRGCKWIGARFIKVI